MIGHFLGALVTSLGDEIKLPSKRLLAHSKLAETLVTQSIASASSLSINLSFAASFTSFSTQLSKNGKGSCTKAHLLQLLLVALINKTVYCIRLPLYGVSASLSTWDKLACKLETHAGSSTVWRTAFNPTARCPRTRPSAVETIPSTRSSARPALANMCLARCLSTSSPPL